MKVTNTLKETLLRGAIDDVTKAREALAEASSVLTWVRSLTVGNEFTSPEQKPAISKRYYVRSRSGNSEGHYIVRYTDGTIDCSCPGFLNRQSCWATKSNQYQYNSWVLSTATFDVNRREAIDAYYKTV